MYTISLSQDELDELERHLRVITSSSKKTIASDYYHIEQKLSFPEENLKALKAVQNKVEQAEEEE